MARIESRVISFAGTTITSGITGSGTATQVAYFNGASTLTSAAGFTFDGTILQARSMVTRYDQNASTLMQVRNDHAGASAAARLAVTSESGDFNIYANSIAAGDSVQLTADSTFGGGLQIGIAGSNTLGLYTNSVAAITISGSQAIALNGTTTISNSSGPQLTVKDGGTFAVNADPHIQFSDFAGAGGAVGFYDAASNDLSLRNFRASGDTIVLALQQVILNSGGGNTFRATAGGVAISSIAGFGNNAAASGPVGNVVGKIRVTDGSGSYIGYLPVYDAIT